jgi:hypothetical protein
METTVKAFFRRLGAKIDLMLLNIAVKRKDRLLISGIAKKHNMWFNPYFLEHDCTPLTNLYNYLRSVSR